VISAYSAEPSLIWNFIDHAQSCIQADSPPQCSAIVQQWSARTGDLVEVRPTQIFTDDGLGNVVIDNVNVASFRSEKGVRIQPIDGSIGESLSRRFAHFCRRVLCHEPSQAAYAPPHAPPHELRDPWSEPALRRKTGRLEDHCHPSLDMAPAVDTIGASSIGRTEARPTIGLIAAIGGVVGVSELIIFGLENAAHGNFEATPGSDRLAGEITAKM